MDKKPIFYDEITPGDQWYVAVPFRDYDDDETQVLLSVPSRATLSLYSDQAGTERVFTADSDALAGAEGSITLTQDGLQFIAEISVPGSVTIDAAGLGRLYGDLELEWAGGEEPSPWTPFSLIVQIDKNYTTPAEV